MVDALWSVDRVAADEGASAAPEVATTTMAAEMGRRSDEGTSHSGVGEIGRAAGRKETRVTLVYGTNGQRKKGSSRGDVVMVSAPGKVAVWSNYSIRRDMSG